LAASAASDGRSHRRIGARPLISRRAGPAALFATPAAGDSAVFECHCSGWHHPLHVSGRIGTGRGLVAPADQGFHSHFARQHRLPFLLGAGLALWLYPRYAVGTITFTAFAMFIGVAMSVTAFPVLARILTDSKMQTSRMGVLALACAAVDDVTAWCLLALVVGVARAQPERVLVTVSAAAAFILFVLLIVRRGALWLVRRQTSLGKTTQQMFATVCVALLVSALVTERIGIHALFGAFLLGAVVPHDSHLARDIREKCEDLVVVLLLPVFFAFTGMRTQAGLLKEPADWLVCVVIILIASVGKFGGSFFAAHITGSDNREAASLGILMNTRGLMELVVLNAGLDLGVLSPALFAMFVLMAVVTTLATTPILSQLNATAG
jgi:Kef-type K+ transport system membrane component KefB